MGPTRVYFIFTILIITSISCYRHDSNDLCQEHMRCPFDKRSLNFPVPEWLECCSCSQECYRLGSCCPDCSFEDSSFTKWSIHASESEIRPKIGLIISKCSEDWKNESIQESCEASTDSANVVKSKITKFTYLNIFCAICNFDETDYIFPEYLISDYLKLISSKLQPMIQPSIYTGCSKKWLISTSNKSYVDEVTKKCALFYAPLLYINGSRVLIFKNEYCAVCSSYGNDPLFCPRCSKSLYKLQKQPDPNKPLLDSKKGDPHLFWYPTDCFPFRFWFRYKKVRMGRDVNQKTCGGHEGQSPSSGVTMPITLATLTVVTKLFIVVIIGNHRHKLILE